MTDRCVSFFKQYLRLSSEISDDALWRNFAQDAWEKDTLPELAITFVGSRNEFSLTKETKKCLNTCLTKVSKMCFRYIVSKDR